MVRGTLRERPLRATCSSPGSEGTWTVHVPSGEEMTIFEAAEATARRASLLIVLAGKEYGSGSSRDWAAKGSKPRRARGHCRELRANPPLEPADDGDPLSVQAGAGLSLGLTGREWFRSRSNAEAREVTVRQTARSSRSLSGSTRRASGSTRHGGILLYVPRRLLAS